MNIQNKQKARLLRSQGLSFLEIKKILGVSKSSISVWVKDIQLSAKQKIAIEKRAKIHSDENRKTIAMNRKDKHLKIREGYQKEGRDMVKTSDKKFIAGLMLYWAEGWKNRNSLVMANSDPEMMKFFIGFLRDYFNPPEDRIKLKIRWFSDNGLKFEEIKNFWLTNLKLSESSLNQCDMDVHGKTNKGIKKGRLPYGIAVITLSSTSVLQKIFGAIQEFVEFNNPKWVL